MKASSIKLTELLSLRSVFVLASLLFLLFVVLVLPAMSERTAKYTPAGSSFDTDFFYRADTVADKLAGYSAQGRAAYVFDRWTFDLVFPLVYGFFMLAAWAFGLRVLWGVPSPLGKTRRSTASLAVPDAVPAQAARRWPAILLWFPLVGIVLDFVENTTVTILMLSWPRLPAALTVFASLASAGKWLFVGIGLVGALILPLLAVLKVLLGKFNTRANRSA